jgi:quinoprotein relay system zinc metallohydrolase 1
MRWLLLLVACQAQAFDYPLTAQQINPSTYTVFGAQADFTPANGGALANVSFIVTETSVVLIDVGPSKRYGEQLRALIKRTTPKPISHVFITHPHPDHFLGSQAFSDIGVYAVPATRQQISEEGNAYNDNMYRLVQGAMKDTAVAAPKLDAPATLTVGGHRLKLLSLSGHSRGDLAIFDETTQTLFTGDLVFNERTPTTPHAHLPQWQQSLKTLSGIPFKHLIPGHGPEAKDTKPIRQTSDYLAWLDKTLTDAALAGLDSAELLTTPAPKLGPLAVFQAEFARSLAHLYPSYEKATLK